MNQNSKFKDYTSQNNKYLDDLASTPLMAGIVENSSDPLMLGRVQVRIPALHRLPTDTDASYISDIDLPWARPGIFNGAGNDLGQFLPPIPGTRVWVVFEDGDPDKPVYLGGIPTIHGNDKLYNKNNPQALDGPFKVDSDDTPLEVLSVAPNTNIIYKSLKGAVIYYDDTDHEESVNIIDQSGQFVRMANRGTKAIESRRGALLGTNHDSYIEASHDGYTKVRVDDTGTEIVYQSRPEELPADYNPATDNSTDLDTPIQTPKSSIKVTKTGIDMNIGNEMDIRVNGISLAEYIRKIAESIVKRKPAYTSMNAVFDHQRVFDAEILNTNYSNYMSKVDNEVPVLIHKELLDESTQDAKLDENLVYNHVVVFDPLLSNE